jgi:hypothetical protein
MGKLRPQLYARTRENLPGGSTTQSIFGGTTEIQKEIIGRKLAL